MKNGLLDFLQSASNSVAGNVAGPVDLISMGLLKMGVPVGNSPMGGSEWMKQKGLMRDVEQGPARVLGETAGLLGPAVATQFAPQIAKGLLQGADNLAAPTTLNKQTGAIVWHGSPHKFDKFDSSKIGTGEGAQAYGHGLYFAESPGVAGAYKEALSEPEIFLKGRKVATQAGTPMDTAKAWLQDVYDKGFFNSATADPFEQAIKNVKDAPVPDKDSVLSAIQRLKASGANMDKGGALYKVDLPDEHIAKMLDYDKPLAKQPKAVQDAIKARLGQLGYSPNKSGLRAYHIEHGGFADATGETLVKKFFGESPQQSSEFLQQQGIPGVRYLDGGSRGAGKGSSNFVVFPKNEGLLSILERNGQAIK